MRGKAKGAIVNPSDETRKTANRANIDAAGHANVETATRTASDVRRAGVRGAHEACGTQGALHGASRWAHCAVPGGSGSEKFPWGGVLIEGAFPMGGATAR